MSTDGIATVNLETDRLPKDELERRKQFTSMDCSFNVPPEGYIQMFMQMSDGRKVPFKLKKPNWDPKGCIDGFFVEEDVRRQFFYPYLPCSFIDVGAAHGSWSLPALATGSSVLAFEIDPRYQQTMLEGVNINEGFNERLTLYAVGLYNEHGIGQLFELENVTFAPLDLFLRSKPFAPQYIKIDTEGTELRILKGMRKTIDLFHPKIFVEIHYGAESTTMDKRNVDKEIIDLLKEYDYKYERGRGDKAFNYFLFT